MAEKARKKDKDTVTVTPEAPPEYDLSRAHLESNLAQLQAEKAKIEADIAKAEGRLALLE